MKKVDEPVATKASVRPVQAALLFIIALALVTLLIPFTIAPLVQRWLFIDDAEDIALV